MALITKNLFSSKKLTWLFVFCLIVSLGIFTKQFIELKNIKTMLNGYETPKPLNQKAKDLEMVIFVSTSEEQVLRKIENNLDVR